MRPQNTKRSNSSKNSKALGKILGETLDETLDDSDFESPATDDNVTNYNISNLNKSNTSRKKATLRTPSLRTSAKRNQALTSTAKTLTSSAKPSTSSAKTSTSSAKPSTSSAKTSTSSAKTSVPATTKKSKPKRKQAHPKKNNIDKEIRYLRQTSHQMIPKLPFSRVIKEILLSSDTTHTKRITYDALKALHEISEIYLVALLQDSYLCTLHRNRVTLEVKDMELVRFFRGASDPLNK